MSETHVRWRHPTRAPYVSSLLVYDGLVYMATEGGIQVVARNRLDARTLASLAIVDGCFLIRTDDRLYCVGD